jgi:hypothetical protein
MTTHFLLQILNIVAGLVIVGTLFYYRSKGGEKAMGRMRPYFIALMLAWFVSVLITVFVVK